MVVFALQLGEGLVSSDETLYGSLQKWVWVRCFGQRRIDLEEGCLDGFRLVRDDIDE